MTVPMAQETLRGRAGMAAEDGDSSEDDAAYECERLRSSIERQFRDAIRSDGVVMNDEVMKASMEGLQEDKMFQYGARSYKEQREWLEQSDRKDTPKTIEEARKYSSMYREAVSTMRQEGALTEQNERNLRALIRRNSDSWIRVRDFFEKPEHEENSFKSWVKNWKEIGEKMKDIKGLKQKAMYLKGVVPSVDALETDEFKNGKASKRLEMVRKALTDLTKYEYGHQETYKAAKAHLRYAVEQGGLPASKVDGWLAHIFTKTDAETYVLHVLPSRVRDWIDESKTYSDLEERAKQANISCRTPEEYLGMSYQQRRSEVARLRGALDGIEKASTHPMLAQVQERLDAEDFGTAKKLATTVGAMPNLTSADRRYLFDLTQQIDMELQASDGATSGKAEKSPEIEVLEKRAELEKEIHKLPHELFQYYVWALREGGPKKWARLRRLRVWHYNVKWAHAHGFLPDEKAFRQIKEDTPRDTRHIERHGHRARGVEKIDVSKIGQGEQNMFRPIASGLSRGATYFRFGKNDVDPLRKTVDTELTDEKINYWGLAIGEETTLKQSLESYDPISNALKGLQGAENAAGMQNERMDAGYGTIDTEVQYSTAA